MNKQLVCYRTTLGIGLVCILQISIPSVYAQQVRDIRDVKADLTVPKWLRRSRQLVSEWHKLIRIMPRQMFTTVSICRQTGNLESSIRLFLSMPEMGHTGASLEMNAQVKLKTAVWVMESLVEKDLFGCACPT